MTIFSQDIRSWSRISRAAWYRGYRRCRGSSTHLVVSHSHPSASVLVDGPGPSTASSTAKLRLQDLRAGAKRNAKQTHLSSEKAALTPQQEWRRCTMEFARKARLVLISHMPAVEQTFWLLLQETMTSSLTPALLTVCVALVTRFLTAAMVRSGPNPMVIGFWRHMGC